MLTDQDYREDEMRAEAEIEERIQEELKDVQDQEG